MLRTQPKLRRVKGLGPAVLEYIVLALLLAVVALRATYTEALPVQPSDQPGHFRDSFHSLSLSTVLILVSLGWMVYSFCFKRTFRRLGLLSFGFALFTAGAVLSSLFAPDKRAAITNYLTLAGPVLMAVVLMQILDSITKVRLVLTVLVALGVVCAYQCCEQFFYTNQVMIEQYRQDPKSMLEPLGIEPGTLAHMLFEHRLFSRGIHGFFTTSNSAGSFVLLTLFVALALFINEVKSRKSDPSASARIPTAAAALSLLTFTLVITASKGAIIASLIAAGLFAVYLRFGSWINAHKKVVLAGCLAATALLGAAVVGYGLAYDRLPGGNSMLVRWQYWKASARMYLQKPFTAAGPGNFIYFYPRYKEPAALEAVADPHNFLLSILLQYGPLGLAGLLVMCLAPLYRTLFSPPPNPAPKTLISSPKFSLSATVFAIFIAATLVLIRPIFIKIPPDALPAEKVAAAFMLYLMPVIAFCIGFLLATAGRAATVANTTTITTTALMVGLAGVLIHNLVDFAIFEPGILTAFWAALACLVALNHLGDTSRQYTIQTITNKKRIAVVATAAVLVLAYFNYAYLPVAASTAKIQKAYRFACAGLFNQAHNLLEAAAEDDRWSPIAPALNGRLYLRRYEQAGSDGCELLLKARDCFLEAVRRNDADFKNFECLADIYRNLAQKCPSSERSDFLHKAFENASKAVQLYPGCGRLHFKLAQIAEQLGRFEFALQQYERAVEIEKSYRLQFRRMYPGDEVVSRLGQENFESAQGKIKALQEQVTKHSR